MIRITYDPFVGFTLPDGMVHEYVNNVVYGGNCEITIGCESIINEFRVAIYTGIVAADNIVFVFNDEEFHPNDEGRLSHWPDGFCDIITDQLYVLLGGKPK